MRKEEKKRYNRVENDHSSRCGCFEKFEVKKKKVKASENKKKRDSVSKTRNEVEKKSLHISSSMAHQNKMELIHFSRKENAQVQQEPPKPARGSTSLKARSCWRES